MRLLKLEENGTFNLTKHPANKIPKYAILSHTWGAEDEEVSFKDMKRGAATSKTGYEKIQFCGCQAAKESLKYFWVDTCCIDKSDNQELQGSINSMFRWYRDAEICYVYLSDISGGVSVRDGELSREWKRDFRKSRWFTRAWTLQELIAPKSVQFFSKEGERLGGKRSLEQTLFEITGIPPEALRGCPLSNFSVEERMSWAKSRQSKYDEDAAYSLLGIFGVFMSPLYGEGKEYTFYRLQKEIKTREAHLTGKSIATIHNPSLRITDPHDDKRRIENTKGDLLEDSYSWILDNTEFRQWQDDEQSRLLWIKGDPGKGKTMLLCGIVHELKKSVVKMDLLSYFFCQATDSRINNATAVIRGLIYLLIDQKPSLISHIRKKYDRAGKALFLDANAWVALSEIFTNILQDPSLNSTYLIIDALDECVEDLPKLLKFIVEQSSALPREFLKKAKRRVRLSLELNMESVSAAVGMFIQWRVLQLSQDNKYDNKTREAVQHFLSSNADGTFLWVALVCQNLKDVRKRNVIKKLDTFPPGLDSLYQQMMQQLSSSDDADVGKEILALAATVYRPITLEELVTLTEQLKEMADDPESIQEIIEHCVCKDFLFAKAFDKVFPYGTEATHHTIFSKSMQEMSRTLRRDIYNLDALGYPPENVEQLDPDPLSASRYSVDLQDGGAVDSFLRKQYLYWLEALSLCKSMPKGLVSMTKLESLIQLVRDAHRFIMSHKWAIENSPLQAYISVLIFSPTGSLIRDILKKEEPCWISIKPGIGDKWSACLQTLKGHSSYVSSVAFSYDSTRLASASHDNTVKIWDPSNGDCLQTLNDVWIRHRSENLLWLPSEYRPSCSAVSGNTIGIGVGSGRPWLPIHAHHLVSRIPCRFIV
ncbi:HET-domain-containing protein [Delitschia confertaspora ATCC 74209]|uniref:HET-domain-containing protein n=1 Tax=Delitschia confertaspora ATCC 74209 TaxID=1513339 RepID=A0A9P4MS62_9PLEO|nr:HET-domain-containing protein [Delitschia confertaspora ATCC 74209]